MTKDELAIFAIAGNEAAFVQLMQQYEHQLYRIAYSYMRNEHDAVEAMQELTYRSYRNIRSIKESQYIRTWLTRILINICHDMLRKQKREIPSDLVVDQHLDHRSDQATEIEILDTLTSLNDEQRELIMMKYIEDRSNVDIAQSLNIPEGTVKSRLHYALRKLRLLFKEEGI
ncbi:sigma-70 family RNA polymerase sigma factor [Paenibacillus endoradicis]|uniref:sigma-70 family RNA polymerase sigma factor n=1 Tax=Paenibacillus endoradicis TaxID=2972487 RepID=UPI0021595171|nr:sigma-70 family RNA polymerase sigma factor [Paenibacillus endoradicis]MCR8658872.1 sigma-70 family RNA polymerase sigma factor [Paenibacillus endoradicis]